MSLTVRNLPLAEIDAVEAACWYEQKAPGLGAKFFEALDSTSKKIAANPTLYRIRFADVRRVSLRGFPFYGAYYVIRGDEVWIIAVHHGRKYPASLVERREGL